MAIDTSLISVGIALFFSQISLGGGIYEHWLIDPVWPYRPALVLPSYGGIHRVRFWLPAHIAFELALLSALILNWKTAGMVRECLLVALASHATMRIWSAFDFIPKALQFEKMTPESIDLKSAQRWAKRSLGRLPLSLLTNLAMLAAFYMACRHGIE